eukprot:CAMPEP_0184313086 /NCGR_PEP_ID=MMETSP1049-20130417/58925_1 /TAXON_ID=77928 /ORGANISM="Proteomonas sulcata, Strain CCMP704" /LENGTH=37 /DNA_ID= /DNA_START= /DNA_END= /DNA_ORIENTATION=
MVGTKLEFGNQVHETEVRIQRAGFKLPSMGYMSPAKG